MQRWLRFSFLVLLIGMLGADRLAVAQGRLSDKDLQRLMQNLKDDAQPFRQSFANALKKSTIRKTSQEKDAKATVKSFQTQTQSMLDVFQHTKKAETTLPGVLSTARQIDGILSSVSLGGATPSDWAKCKAELSILANEFNMPSHTN